MNLAVNFAGVSMKNPVTTASGTFGSGAEYGEYVDLNRLGAVTTKGVANVPWPGNPTPRVCETYGGMLNAIGLQNPGIDVFIERDIPVHPLFEMTDGSQAHTRPFSHFLLADPCGKTVLLQALAKERDDVLIRCINILIHMSIYCYYFANIAINIHI